MKKVTKEYEVYEFGELSQDAKAKALEEWAACDDFPFLQDNLREYIHERLAEAGYRHGTITPLYDLNYCQGCGLMFEGTVWDKERTRIYEITQAGNYCHEHSANIEGRDEEGNYIETALFEKLYRQICRDARDVGRQEIEYQQSEEYFAEACEANGYTFLKDGTMFSA